MRRGTYRTRRPKKRKLVWARTTGQFNIVAGTPQSADLLATFETAYGAQLLGATIMRIRGYESYLETQAIQLTVTTHVGIIVGPQDLDANDVDPSATTGAFNDWMSYTSHRYSGRYLATGDATVPSLGPLHEYSVDVKAKRRLEELNQSLWIVANSVTNNFTYHYNLSILLALA